MKVLIIYCHPSDKSYTSEVLRQLKQNLEQEGIKYELLDLYRMHFQSDMSELEYEREGFVNKKLPISDDVRKEQEKIDSADCIIFLYPVWWSDCPAKLKGWFDRVYSVGYAYGYDETDPVERMNKMNQVTYGLVICTAGHSNAFLDEIGISRSMTNVMLDDRLGERFINKEMIILGGTIELEKVRSHHAEIISGISQRIREYSVWENK